MTDRRTCTIDGTGSLHCWGDGEWGAIGDGLGAPQLAPVRLPLSGVAEVALGFLHGCALGADGSVRCWGEASQGQLGFDPKDCPTPAPGGFALDIPHTPLCLPAPGPLVPSVPAGDALLCSANQSCTLTRGGHELYCWGSSEPGQQSPPTRLVGITGAVTARAGANHGCALSKQGEVWCWGKSSYGELGTRRMVDVRAHPTKVRGIAGATRLWAGGFSTCAGFADGTVQCWGALPNLGNRAEAMLSPTPVPELSGAVEAALSVQHGCALWADGAVRCWGHSFAGAHGGEAMRQTTLTPLRWQ